MSEVKILRLTTGEEILCKTEQTDNGWKAIKPALVIPVGKGQIGLMGWMPYTKAYENGIDIKDEHVMFISDPHEELLNEYSDAFGSGLIVPKQELKITT